MRLQHHALLLLLGISASGICSAQSTPASNFPEASTANAADTGKTPVFKAQTEVVAVPVVVRDKHGNSVTGLTKDQFVLEENGKPRDIASFDEVKPAPTKPLAAVQDIGYSNLPLDDSQRAHVTIVVLDLINTSEIQRTDGKEQLIRFFSKDLPAGEPVSLLCLTPQGVKLIHPFTSDQSSLVRSLKEFKVESHTLGALRDITRQTLSEIREIAKAYAGVPGRKSMVMLSGYLVYSEEPSSPLGDLRPDYEETWAALLSANIAVYPTALSIAAPNASLRNLSRYDWDHTLRFFSDRTGGVLCEEDNRLKNCLNTAIEDSRSYYMLTYNLPPDDRKPGWRSIKVKVSAQSVEVRAREGFYYESVDSNAKPKPVKPHADEINALASPLAESGVLMNVRVLPQPTASPTADGKITQHFLLTIPLSSVTIDPTQDAALDLEVGAIALDKKIKDAGELLHPVRGNPKPETLKQFASDGIRLEEKLDLPPGTYDMRFVVRDNPSGKIGTVVFPLEVK